MRTAPAEYWPKDQLHLFTPRYNIAPSQPVAAVRVEEGQPRLVELRWGLIPSWAGDEKIGYRMINARAESVAEKPAFRSALARRRCLILADGFYEWKRQGRSKQPYFVRLGEDRPFALAGLWERWWGPKQARRLQPLESCTIITTRPNELTRQVHDRMPVILRRQDEATWMDPELDQPEPLADLLQPYAADEMEMYAVSTLVNKPANDSPECVQPVPVQQRFA